MVCVSFHFLLLKVVGLLPVNNHPEDTPPNTLNTTFDYISMKLGISRFRMLHFKQKTRFNWKQHVRFGIVAATIWLIGIFGGLYTVKANGYGLLITGYHAKIGLLMISFILFAVGSGFLYERKEKEAKSSSSYSRFMEYGDVVSCFITDFYKYWRLPDICTGVLIR